MAIQLLPLLFKQTTVSIIGPTYSEHFNSWSRANHQVKQNSNLANLIYSNHQNSIQLSEYFPHQTEFNARVSGEKSNPEYRSHEMASSICVLVNPNNPDGRTISKREVETLLEREACGNKWLIIDEAFMDLEPQSSAVDLVAGANCVILKSFGKFFGLAGLRLGFVIGPPSIIDKLSSQIGPWPVNGPALSIGATAMGDLDWQSEMRETLLNCRNRLDRLLLKYELIIAGGTNLFRLIKINEAEKLFLHLLEHKIYTRRFHRFPTWLRLGIPHLAEQLSRLELALSTFRNSS